MESLLFLTALVLTPVSVCAQARFDELSSTANRQESGSTQDGIDNSNGPRQPLRPAAAFCASPEINPIQIFHLDWGAKNCLALLGGFSGISGSFVGLSYSTQLSPSWGNPEP